MQILGEDSSRQQGQEGQQVQRPCGGHMSSIQGVARKTVSWNRLRMGRGSRRQEIRQIKEKIDPIDPCKPF